MSCCCALQLPAPASGSRDLWVWSAQTMGNNTIMLFLGTAASTAAAAAVEDGGIILIETPGVLTTLRVRLAVALGSNASFTVRVNAVATSLTLIIAAGNLTGVITGGSAAVVAGDRVAIATQTVAAEAGTSRPRAVVQIAT